MDDSPKPASLYAPSHEVVWGPVEYPVCTPKDHTLLDALPEYVNNKLEDDITPLLGEAVRRHLPVYVAGVYHLQFTEFCRQRKWEIEETIDNRTQRRREQKIPLFDESETPKLYNTIRPSGHRVKTEDGRTLIIVCVTTPGKDYLKHIAQLVRFQIGVVEGKYMKQAGILSVRYFPDAHQNFMKHTALEEVLAGRCENAIVFLGYVQYLESYFRVQTQFKEFVGSKSLYSPSGAYGCNVMQFGGKRLVFLGVVHTFWGDLAGQLAEKLYQLGASTILYVAKLGALTSPEDVVRDIFVPKEFFLMTYGGGVGSSLSAKNVLESAFEFVSNVQKGGHLSVPTIMDETKASINVWRKQGDLRSMDNEISYMAQVAKAPKELGVAHFATDFLNVWNTIPASKENMLKTTTASVASILKTICDTLQRFVTLLGQQKLPLPAKVDKMTRQQSGHSVEWILHLKNFYLRALLLQRFHTRIAADESFEDVFVEPLIERSGDRPVTVVESVTLARDHPLVICGRSGDGKSCCLKRIARLWALDGIPDYSCVVYVRLPELGLRSAKLANHHLFGALLLYFKEELHVIQPQVIVDSHRETGLFLFDGYDELPPELHSVLQGILRKQFRHIIICTRLDVASKFDAFQVLTIRGLRPDMSDAYLRRTARDQNIFDRWKAHVTSFASIFRSPLFLHLLTVLPTDDPLPSTRTEVIRASVLAFLQRGFNPEKDDSIFDPNCPAVLSAVVRLRTLTRNDSWQKLDLQDDLVARANIIHCKALPQLAPPFKAVLIWYHAIFSDYFAALDHFELLKEKKLFLKADEKLLKSHYYWEFRLAMSQGTSYDIMQLRLLFLSAWVVSNDCQHLAYLRPDFNTSMTGLLEKLLSIIPEKAPSCC